MNRVDITGLDKAEVLLALYNASHPQGMGFFQEMINERLTIDDARKMFGRHAYFDYVRGRVIKVNLSENTFDPREYDRDNGEGTAQRVIDSLKRTTIMKGEYNV